MDDVEQLRSRLDDLEMRFTFQQEALDSLGNVVTNQWREIDRLHKALGLLEERVAQCEAQEPRGTNERPPHY